MRSLLVLPPLLTLLACSEKSLPLVSPYKEMNLPVAGGTVIESMPERMSVDHKGVDRAKTQAAYIAALTAWGCKEDGPPKLDAAWTHWSCKGNDQQVKVTFEASAKHTDRLGVMLESKAAQ